MDWYWLVAMAAAGLVIAAFVVRRLARLDSIGLSILGWLLVAVLIAGSTGTGLMWLLGWPTVPRSSTFSTAETLDLLKIALAVVAGFGGVVLLAVNYRKQRFTEKAHLLSEGQENREQTKLLNERFASAAEQLGHDEASVRLAGVYAMAGLADDWPAGRQQCVEVLIAYLRLSTSEDYLNTDGEGEVLSTIFRAFRARLGRSSDVLWSSLDFDFTGVTFVDADFGGLLFVGNVTFDGAAFAGARTSFAGTWFKGTLSCHGTAFHSHDIDFQKAWFDGAVEFVGARFEAARVDFGWSLLDGASMDFFRCTFEHRCELMFTNLELESGALRFERCNVGETTLNIRSAVVGPWSVGRRPIDVLLGREHLNLSAVLAIIDCSFDECTVDIEGVYVMNGRLIIRDIELVRSRLDIRSLQAQHQSVLLRRIEQRESTVDIPWPWVWGLRQESSAQ